MYSKFNNNYWEARHEKAKCIGDDRGNGCGRRKERMRKAGKKGC